MKFCVIKDTAKVIDENEIKEKLLENAQNAGFAESEVEILTEEEYQQRLESEPKPPQPITAEQRIANAEQAINDLMMIIMMGGLQNV